MIVSQRTALQAAIAVGCLVPLSAGLAGIVVGPALVDSAVASSVDGDSHFRYLSGLLLAIGIGYVSTIHRVETKGARFNALTAMVVLGGLGRLVSVIAAGVPSAVMIAALCMELVVSPGLAVWRWRVAAKV